MHKFMPVSGDAHVRRESAWKLAEPDAPRGIDFFAERAFELGRANMALNTHHWLCDSMATGAVSAYESPVSAQITAVQLVNVVPGSPDMCVLLEAEEKKPFGTHQMYMRYHDHVACTGGVWGVEDVVGAMRLLKLKVLEKKYDGVINGEAKIAEVLNQLVPNGREGVSYVMHLLEVRARHWTFRDLRKLMAPVTTSLDAGAFMVPETN